MVKQITIKHFYSSVKKYTSPKKIKIMDYFKYEEPVKCEKVEPSGITYLLTNPAQPFQIKCGETTQFEKRIKTLSGTSVSEKFKPIAAIQTNDWKSIEKEMHDKFSKYRVNKKREFFGFSIDNETTGADFEALKTKYTKLQKKMIKKLYKYANNYNGIIII